MIVACCLFRYFPYGGLSRDFRRVAQELISRGHTVRAYVQDWDGEQIVGVETIFVKCSAPTNHGKILQYIQQLKLLLKKNHPDIVFGFNKMPDLDFYFMADVCYVNKVEQEKKGIKKFLYKLTPRYRLFRKFEESVFGKTSNTRIFLLDECQRGMFDHYYDLPDSRAIVLPPGLSRTCCQENYPSSKINIYRDKLGLTNGMKLIVQVGSDFSRKGVDRSLKALASLPEFVRKKTRYVVIGKDDSAPFKNMAAQLGISDLVDFRGGQPSAELDIASADVLLHPAYVENTGTVILEALALLTPSIVSGCCGFAHYVDSIGYGVSLSEPFQQTEFNESLYRMLTDESFVRDCKNNARQYIAKHSLYDMPSVIVDKLEQFCIDKGENQ